MRIVHERFAVVAALVLAWSVAQASHLLEQPKRHKIFYHLDEPGVERAKAVLVNIENHVSVVGWKNIEALELVVHGPALRTFLAKDTVAVLVPDRDTAEHYARVFVQLKRAGTPVPDNDLWIAAMTLQHDLVLITRDQHFERIPQLPRA